MQKWQRNQVFKAIEAVGLDPKEFKLDGPENRINHRWSESYFIIGPRVGHYKGHYVVGDGPRWPHEEYSWQSLMERVSRWLEEVKEDLEMPDLWADLEREAELFDSHSDDKNTPFSPKEQKEITQRLQELREGAKQTYSLTAAQVKDLDAKLDYLVDAASRLGRTDWKGLFIGSMTSWALAAALPPDAARHIMLTLLRGVGHFYGLPVPSG